MTTWRPLLTGLAHATLMTLLAVAVGRGVDGDLSPAALVAVAIALGGGAGLLAWWTAARASADQIALEGSQRRAIVHHVLAQGPARRTREQTGRLVSTATDAVERSAQYKATFLGSMLGSVASPLLVAALLAVLVDVRSGLILMAVVPAVPVLIGGFRSAFTSVSSRYRTAARAFASLYLDSVQGLPTLRTLGAGRTRARVLAAEAEKVRRAVMKLLLGNQLILLVTDAVFSLAMIVTGTLLSATGLRDGRLSVGDAFALVLGAVLMTEPLDRIGQFFYIGMGGIASTKEISRTLAEPLPDTRHADDATTHEPSDCDGTIRLDRVSFAYDPDGEDARTVLSDLSLEVTPGERVVLAGRTGVGKSTVLSLVQGLRAPQRGTVSLGGHDLASTPSGWAHRQIALVSQSTHLFTGTLRENLLLAAPDATEDQLWAALKVARLNDEVDDWPDGLDTEVGERGLSLSGGQAQRVAIARAMLVDAPIVLLDEPTSQTDLESEAAILAALADLCEGRTVLAVGHREAMLASATRIVTLEGAA